VHVSNSRLLHPIFGNHHAIGDTWRYYLYFWTKIRANTLCSDYPNAGLQCSFSAPRRLPETFPDATVLQLIGKRAWDDSFVGHDLESTLV
jgi:hypothetical protein